MKYTSRSHHLTEEVINLSNVTWHGTSRRIKSESDTRHLQDLKSNCHSRRVTRHECF
jgi:hypothetical protein